MEHRHLIHPGPLGSISRKEVALRGRGSVTLGVFAPLAHELSDFYDRAQLGENNAFFVGGSRTRIDHFFGVFKITDTVLQRMRFSDDPATDLRLKFCLLVLALVHDIGHGPESHLIEFAYDDKHHEYGLSRLDAISQVIDEIGFQYCGNHYPYADLVRTLYISMDHPLEDTHPLRNLHHFVSHPLFGSDKLEYLASDPDSTGFVSENYHSSTWMDSLLKHIQWDRDRGIGIYFTKIEGARRQARRYVDNYLTYYFERHVTLGYRMKQRAFSELHTLFDVDMRSLRDAQFAVALEQKAIESQNPIVCDLVRGAKKHIYYKNIATLCLEEGAGIVTKPRDPRLISTISYDDAHTLCKKLSPFMDHVAIENKLADTLSLEHGQVLVTTMPSPSVFERKIDRLNCVIFDDYNPDDTRTLFERDPLLQQELYNQYRSKFTIRICVHPDANLTQKQSLALIDTLVDIL